MYTNLLIDRDFLLAQGAIQRLFQIALKVADPLLFGFIIRLLEEFSYDSTQSISTFKAIFNKLIVRSGCPGSGKGPLPTQLVAYSCYIFKRE